MANALAKAWSQFYGSLNFFRLHLLFFTFTPLISASVFYAANGLYPVSFIDALFLCVSSMTLTGLATIDLSSLTGFQQALLFVLMCIGSPVAVSWLIVYIRRRYFQRHLSHIIAEELKREHQGGIIAAMRERTASVTRSFSRDHPPAAEGPEKPHPRPGFFRCFADRMPPAAVPEKSPSSTISGAATPSSADAKRKLGVAQRLRTDMIRRIETAPQRVNPMGRIGGEVVGQHLPKGKEREEGQAQYDGGELPRVAHSEGEGGARARNGTILTPPLLGADGLSSQFAMNVLVPGQSTESSRDANDNMSADVQDPRSFREEEETADDEMTPNSRSANGHRTQSRGRSMTDTDALSSHRAGLSHSPVRFKSPPTRVTPGTLGDDLLSPNRPREPDHMSTPLELERQESDATAFRDADTGDFPRTQTIEFAYPLQPRGRTGTRRQSAGVDSERERMRFRNFTMSPGSPGGPLSDAGEIGNGMGVEASSQGHGFRNRAPSAGRQRMGSVSTAYFPRTATGRSHGTTRVNPAAQIPSSQSGYGGFPMPHELVGRAIKKLFPQTLTLSRTLTGESPGGEAREVPYISFNAVVGRNSQFHDLSKEEQDELSGVEYRALGALLWIIAGYHFGIQLLAFVIVAPTSSMRKWAPVFSEEQHRFVPPTWFAAFQCVSAYTNAGISLVDQSMVPFQNAYPMMFTMVVLILAGNTAFPIFLRFTIWLLSKVVGRRLHETLSFLLDHPRRCFTSLFPSHQTWFLFILVVCMVITDWVSFLVLDIGNNAIEAIPIGTRIAIALLQAAAVRTAGFAIVSISALAPAVKVLYVVMMYIAAYPIAISVRATNVYEEQSLGIYQDGHKEDDEEPNPSGGPMHAWGGYIAWHARRQLSFDMWWLAFALWLVCIIERAEIMNPESNGWFDIFAIIFELTSAYGTVGLSTGIPTANYSFSGALKTLSKLVIIAVMLRGRHRGLPHAIDRAILLPREYTGDTGTNGSNNSGPDLPGNGQRMADTGASVDGGYSTGRVPTAHGVDLKRRTNTLLSPVHEILTPVTSVTHSPKTTFDAMGAT